MSYKPISHDCVLHNYQQALPMVDQPCCTPQPMLHLSISSVPKIHVHRSHLHQSYETAWPTSLSYSSSCSHTCHFRRRRWLNFLNIKHRKHKCVPRGLNLFIRRSIYQEFIEVSGQDGRVSKRCTHLLPRPHLNYN